MLRSHFNCAEDVLARLPNADLLDEHYLDAARLYRIAVVPRLREIAEGSGLISLNASHLLLLIGEADGLRGLIDKLGGSDPKQQLAAVERLVQLPFYSERGGHQVSLDKAAIYVAVCPLLGSPETRTVDLALNVLMRLGMPEADAVVMSRIDDPKAETRANIARWLGRKGLDNGALRVVEDLLLHPQAIPYHRYENLRYGLIHAVEDLCRKGSAEARLRACSLATHFVRKNLNRSDNRTANHVWHCLEGIAAAAPLDESLLLKEVLASSLESWVRGIALKRLAQIEGDDGFVRLRDALKDPELCVPAAEALAGLAKRPGDRRMIDAAAGILESETSQRVIAHMVKAFLLAGGASAAVLQRVIDRADPATAMTIHWALQDIGPKDAVRQLIAAGVTTTPSTERMEDYEKLWEEHRDARGLVFTIAFHGGTLADIVTKTGDYPADHAEAINDLCAKTRGAFEVTDLHQSEGGEDKLEVGFACDGKPHRLQVNHFGRYLDLPSVLNGLNGLLEDTGHESRFFQIRCEGEVALVIFAAAAEFPQVAQRLRIPIETDHDAPRQSAIAYTSHVLRVVNSGRQD